MLLDFPEIEYVGFRYWIDFAPDGSPRAAIPFEGQHKAASKDKHCRAALEEYINALVS